MQGKNSGVECIRFIFNIHTYIHYIHILYVYIRIYMYIYVYICIVNVPSVRHMAIISNQSRGFGCIRGRVYHLMNNECMYH